MAKNEEGPIAEILNLQCVAQSPSFIYDAVIKYPDKKRLRRKFMWLKILALITHGCGKSKQELEATTYNHSQE